MWSACLLYARCCVYALDIIILFGLHNCSGVKRAHTQDSETSVVTHLLRGRAQSDNMPVPKSILMLLCCCFSADLDWFILSRVPGTEPRLQQGIG